MSDCCKNRKEFFSSIKDVEFLGPFASSQKARFGFPCPSARMSACLYVSLCDSPSVCMYQRVSYWTDFRKI